MVDLQAQMKKKKKNYVGKRIQVGLNIALVRKDKELRQEDVAEKMKVKRQRVGKLESGKNCEVDSYYVAATALGMVFEELAAYHITRKFKTKK
jgi:transcriptional regulator with XRE-family HTH domain